MKNNLSCHKVAWLIVCVVLMAALLAVSCSSTASTTPTTATTSTAATANTPSQTKPATTAAAPVTTAPATTQTKPATTTSSNSNKYGGTLRVIDPFIPAQPIGAPWEAPLAVPSMQAVLAKIMGQKADGTLQPELALSWDQDTSAATPSITFHLRQGVTFHDGTTFNAQAVKWNLEKQKAGNLFNTTIYFKSFDVIDDYTIRVNLTEWRNAFPPSFAGI